jgi:hypothetical protein
VAAWPKTAVTIASGVLAVGAGVGVASVAYADTIAPAPNPTSAPSDVRSPESQPPVEPGNPYQAPAEPGNPYQPPAEPGNPYQAPAEPGNPYQAPAEPGNPYQPPTEPGNPYPGSSDDALIEELSRVLGIDTETLKAMLEEIRVTYGDEWSAAVNEQLDAAVQAGLLTQAEADAVRAAINQSFSNLGR